jgi:hypothetical protein
MAGAFVFRALERFWMAITGVSRVIKGHIDVRTEGKPTKREEYRGVCKVQYYDISIRRYLDALAQGLMERAVGKGEGLRAKG